MLSTFRVGHVFCGEKMVFESISVMEHEYASPKLRHVSLSVDEMECTLGRGENVAQDSHSFWIFHHRMVMSHEESSSPMI